MIKQILDGIGAESSTNKKMEILSNYKDNELLKRVIYLAYSKRIKFYIKSIPEYSYISEEFTLEEALIKLDLIINRELRGHEAINMLKELLGGLNSDNAYIIERIIDKNLKIGMGTRNINKVLPKHIEKTGYMGAKSYNPEKVSKLFNKYEYCFSQIKMDGRYCSAIIREGNVEMESRQGEPTILNGAEFVNELSNLDDCVLNGELTIPSISRYESNGIIASLIDILGKSSIRTPEETQKKIKKFETKHMGFYDALNKVVFTVWDIIDVKEYYDNKSTTPYYERLERLNNVIKDFSMVSVVETKKVYSYEEAMKHFQEMLNQGEEGTIVKTPDNTWKDGKPATQWKIKLEMGIDLKVVGFNYGTGKNENVVSSLNCETSDGILKTRPTGITEELMKEITENQDDLLGSIIEVKCSGLSQDSSGNYSLLHPVFKQFRINDKDIANTLEEVKEIENMVKGLSDN